MKIARLFGLATFMSVVVCLAVASAALATEPLFNPAAGQSITGTSGTSTLTTLGNARTITCKKSTATGVVSSSLLAGKIFVHYLECTSKEGSSAACTVKSLGAPEKGLIITKELHGILGLILPSLETGILFLPVASKVFVELAAGEGTAPCTPETKITGSVAGLVEPVGKKQSLGTIKFTQSGGASSITKIHLTHHLGLVEPELVAFTTTSGLEQSESVTFGVETEVT
jgi:hypothetical protein